MKKKPAGRTLAEFFPLSAAEDKLLEACAQGIVAKISDQRPEKHSDSNFLRATFVRFLALGGDDEAQVHEHGVQLQGAWLDGVLDLDGAQLPFKLGVFNSHLTHKPECTDARIEGSLNFSGSHLPGLRMSRICLSGSLFLNAGFTATGEIHMLGAYIGGSLDCSGATLDVKEGKALSADRADIKGSVFLKAGFTATGQVRFLGAQIGSNLECAGAKLDVKEGSALTADRADIKGSVFLTAGFAAIGEVRLLGAQIGGNLECVGAKLDGKEGSALTADGAGIKGSVFLNASFAAGEVRLVGTQIGGGLDCSDAKLYGKDGRALFAQQIQVMGSLSLRNIKLPLRGVDLTGAFAGCLVDDSISWGENLFLDGFVYERLSGNAPTDAATRLAWLDKQWPSHSGLNGNGDQFKPQPWRQLQKVLRDMGHAEDAREVAIALENRLRKAGLIGRSPQHWRAPARWSYKQLSMGFHWLFRVLIGYGFRPFRLGAWMILVWALCAAFYWYAALQGVMAPSNPLMFQNPNYQSCQVQKNWYLCEALPEEYTGFSPMAYSLDLILPLVNLQQENDWAPLIPTPKASVFSEFGWPWNWSFKHWTRLAIWFEVLFGWGTSLLLVAVVSGLTKRRED